MSISLEISRLIDEIKDNRTDGASQLARQAAGVLKAAAEQSSTASVDRFLLELKEAGERLMSARPAMAPLFNIIAGLLGILDEKAAGMDLDSIRRLVVSCAEKAISNSLKSVARVAELGSELLADGDRIMTHSYSSTVVTVLKKTFDKYGNIKVITTRSGPGRTGESTARQLASHGIPVTFIDDTAIGLYITEVNGVVVGADRVCAGGGLVNGIGTCQLALAAERAHIPFYVFCETLKFDPRITSSEVDLEEKEPSEVVEPGRLPPQVGVKNPYFDITPPELITGIVTENGLFGPQEVIGYMGRQSR